MSKKKMIIQGGGPSGEGIDLEDISSTMSKFNTFFSTFNRETLCLEFVHQILRTPSAN